MVMVPAWPVLLEELMSPPERVRVAVSRSMVPALPPPELAVEMADLRVEPLLRVLWERACPEPELMEMEPALPLSEAEEVLAEVM